MASTRYPKGWTQSDGRLVAAYRFRDFAQAMGFLNEVALHAEAHQHHPDFAVHWNEVRFEVWSHDENRVTSRDEKLVSSIAAIAHRYRPKTLR